MFELIIEKVPELRKLEESVATLEQDFAKAQGRVQGLANRVAQAREDDLNREAAALNSGRKVPPPKEPELRIQLEGAQRELEVLERRRELAQADRARFIQANHERLITLLAEAQAAEGAKVAEGAARVLSDLLRYFKAEDDVRAMGRLVPPAEQENTGTPERTTAIFGPVSTRNVTGGPRRGDLEGALRYLEGLGPTTVVGEDAEGAA
jgi:hypothetical protein